MNSKPKIITFISGKGGAGKTALVANLGTYVAEAKYKVLLIDWDFFTRGLSYYILEGMESISENSGLLEAFEQKNIENLSPYNLKDNLDILVPSINTRRIITFDDRLEILKNARIIEAWNILIKLIKESYEYDFIFIDTHSGSEFLSLIPAFFSDEYIIVCEEDRTSWRVSTLIKDTIMGHSEELELPAPKFAGFILNQTVGTPKIEIIKFLEKQLLMGDCISVIPLDYRARKAFANDELVIKIYPMSQFSQEIRKISKNYLQIKTPFIPFFQRYLEAVFKMSKDPIIFIIVLLMYLFILSSTIFGIEALDIPFLMAFAILFTYFIIRIVQKSQ